MTPHKNAPQRAYWLKTLYQWHWVSAALCLAGMFLFSITGLTLNNASWIDSNPTVSTRNDQLPDNVARLVRESAEGASGDKKNRPLPPALQQWARQQWQLDLSHYSPEWSEDELYISMPRAGGDAWLRLDIESGKVEYELTDRGWLAYFNDLHKGRHTGGWWRWFIDLFAIACVIFSVTGLFIMKMHASNRPMTWPITLGGLVMPLLLMLLFIH